jgi:hypothetical protein
MTDDYSKIDTAKKTATRLIKRNTDANMAERKRDVCLYKLFEILHELDKRLQTIGGPFILRTLKKKYGVISKSKDSGMFLLKLTHPTLDPRTQSKYAAVLRFIRQKKKPDQSIRKFVQANGGLNGCVKKEKRLRNPQKLGHGLGKRQKGQ